MTNFYEWNNKGSIARLSIDNFLSRAQERVAEHPERLPFKAEDGHAVLSWLRAFADRKPIEPKDVA